MQTQTGQMFLLAYSFSLLVAGTLNSKAPGQLPSTDEYPLPNYSMHLTPKTFSQVLIGF